MSKLPSLQFYPGDWLKDPNLRRCTHAAKGVWIDLLCLMFESEERGVLATAGQAWSDDEIARAVGGDRSETLACVQELTLKGVANRQSNGALYSKRLVRDEHKRKLCIEAGKRGGNPNLKRTLKGKDKGGVNGASKGDSKRNPTPSSSSSTSTSVINSLPSSESSEMRSKPGSQNEVLEFCGEIGIPRSDGEHLWHKWEGNGWKNGGTKIRDWKATIRSWKAAGYLPSQKPNGRQQQNLALPQASSGGDW